MAVEIRWPCCSAPPAACCAEAAPAADCWAGATGADAGEPERGESDSANRASSEGYSKVSVDVSSNLILSCLFRLFRRDPFPIITLSPSKTSSLLAHDLGDCGLSELKRCMSPLEADLAVASKGRGANEDRAEPVVVGVALVAMAAAVACTADGRDLGDDGVVVDEEEMKVPIEKLGELDDWPMLVKLACEAALTVAAAVTAAYRLATVPRGLSGRGGFSNLDGVVWLLTLESRSKNSLALLNRETRLADLVKPLALGGFWRSDEEEDLIGDAWLTGEPADERLDDADDTESTLAVLSLLDNNKTSPFSLWLLLSPVFERSIWLLLMLFSLSVEMACLRSMAAELRSATFAIFWHSGDSEPKLRLLISLIVVLLVAVIEFSL